uniref:EF-hand domain-containing protein n=1 Tax=Anser brachyrhynchus TaxID=132585 RepID=A0A8B9CQQ1_9AVES
MWQKVLFCFVFSPHFACTCLFQTSFPLCFCLICTQTWVCFLFRQITMRALGCELRKEEMKRIISQVDEEGSGKINFESFLQVMAQKMVCEPSWSKRLKFLLPNFTMQAEPYSEKEILKGFKLFDYDGTGKISFEKLKLVATEVGEDITDEELQEMIDEADADGDGEVDQQEFLRILTLTDL